VPEFSYDFDSSAPRVDTADDLAPREQSTILDSGAPPDLVRGDDDDLSDIEAVCYASKRQACIAMSSTEAEIIAASACAVEIVHARALLAEMGLPQGGATLLEVDNTGAVALARDRRSCHRSRHVDRRYFKVRELAAEGAIQVEHIGTAANTADLLTKPLPLDAFALHRATAMGGEL
jgi:hypothetical protein